MTTEAWQTITVTTDRYVSDERLDVFVVRQWAQICDVPISRGKVSAAIRAQQIMCNDRKVKPHHTIAVGDRVQIATVMMPVPVVLVPDDTILFNIVFANKDFLVIDKPIGLQVHPAIDMTERTLVQGLLAYDAQIAGVGDDDMRPGIVHRLDRDTSGLMVVARTQSAFDQLKSAFMERTVRKQYIALVHGKSPEDGEISFPIARSMAGNRQMAVRGRARYRGALRDAQTQYRRLRVIDVTDDDSASGNNAQNDIYSLVAVRIYTGRTHQIRVHMRAIGHPVVGDKLYGPRKIRNQFPHQFLHAQSLSFTFDDISYTFSTPLPPAWNNLIGE